MLMTMMKTVTFESHNSKST